MDREKAARLLEMLRMRTEQRGATPAEAAQASDLAAKIIERYGLDAHGSPASDNAERGVECGQKSYADWIDTLAFAIRRRFDLRTSVQAQTGKNVTVRFIGPEHRAKIACWLFRAIEKDMRRMARRECSYRDLTGGAMVRFRNQYFDSFTMTIWERLDPRTPEQKAAAKKEFDDYVAKLPPSKPRKTPYVPAMSSQDWAAYDAGHAAAGTVKLGTDVLPGSTASQPLLLGAN